MVVLKNCEPELSYMPAELCKMCLKEPRFPDCWKVSLVELYLRMLEKDLLLKTTALSLLSVACKFFAKLINNRIVDLLEKCGLFSGF